MREEELSRLLHDHNVDDEIIEDVIFSGYFLHSYHDFSSNTYNRISDKFYGNKGGASVFEPSEFVKYLKNEPHKYQPMPLRRHKVKTFQDIQEIMQEPLTNKFIQSGRMSFRGQSKNHYISRKIPNPIRKDEFGQELTILPGIFRNKPLGKSNLQDFFGESSLLSMLRFLEPGNSDIHEIASYSHDLMRVEQHYTTQTAGLDITFDIRSAIYFATHKYVSDGACATYEKISRGQHQGSLYLFRFLDPPVKKTEFYIRDFDLFRTYTPERVLRQHCALPMFHEYERNIAVTDLHCIIDLHEDFEDEEGFTYNYMFPGVDEDVFYGKLMELKARFPDHLKNVMEYY